MYLDIPKSCEFGGCRLFNDCPNEKYKLEHHVGFRMSPPFDKSKCVPPCEMCEECNSYMDKYRDMEDWADMHGCSNDDY